MEFRTKYSEWKYEQPEVDPESLCQSAGYMRVQDVVKQFETAGLHLAASRQAQYDFIASDSKDDVRKLPKNYMDPTRSKEYDVFRAYESYQRTLDRLRYQAAAAKAAAETAAEGGQPEAQPATRSGAQQAPAPAPEAAEGAQQSA